MGIKFPNVMVELFNQHHLEAALNEAERLGYTTTATRSVERTRDICNRIGKNSPFITAMHFRPCGTVTVHQWFTKDDLIELKSKECKFVKLRKVRILYNKLNDTDVQVKTVSQDNQSVLTVIDRASRTEVIEPSTKPHDVDAYMYDYGHLSNRQCAPYGQLPTNAPDKPDLCTCKGVYNTIRKECNYSKCCGGTCWRNKLRRPTLPVQEPVKWVRPKAENPISTRVVRFLAVSGSKVASDVKCVVKFLRGGL